MEINLLQISTTAHTTNHAKMEESVPTRGRASSPAAVSPVSVDVPVRRRSTIVRVHRASMLAHARFDLTSHS